MFIELIAIKIYEIAESGNTGLDVYGCLINIRFAEPIYKSSSIDVYLLSG